MAGEKKPMETISKVGSEGEEVLLDFDGVQEKDKTLAASVGEQQDLKKNVETTIATDETKKELKALSASPDTLIPQEFTLDTLIQRTTLEKNPEMKKIISVLYLRIASLMQNSFPGLSSEVRNNMQIGYLSYIGDVVAGLPSSKVQLLQQSLQKLQTKLQNEKKDLNAVEFIKAFGQLEPTIHAIPELEKALDRYTDVVRVLSSKADLGNGNLIKVLSNPYEFKKWMKTSPLNEQVLIKESSAFKLQDLTPSQTQDLKKFANTSQLLKQEGLLGQVKNVMDIVKEKQQEFRGMIEEMSGDVLGWKQMLVSIGLWETFKGLADGVLGFLGYKNGFKGFEQNLIEKQLAEGEHKMTEDQKQQLRRTTRDYSTNFLAAKNGNQFDPNTIYGIKAQLLDKDKKEYEKNLYFHEPSLKREIQKILDGQKNGKNLIDKSAIDWLGIDISKIDVNTLTQILLKKIEENLREDPELMEKLMKSNSLTEGDHISAGALALTMLMKGSIGAEAYKVDTPSIYGLIDNATPVEQADGTQESDFKLSESDFDEADFGFNHEIEKPETDVEKIKKNYENKLKDTNFNNKLTEISGNLGLDPSNLYTIIALETGGRFSSSIQNKDTKATGLIQFMPDTAAALLYGKTYIDLKKAKNTDAVAKKKAEAIAVFANMKEVDQLQYVQKYLEIYNTKIRKDKNSELGDLYMAVFYPKFIGQPLSTEFPKEVYNVNKGLDKNKDKKLTVGDVHDTIKAKYQKLFSENDKSITAKNTSRSSSTPIASVQESE